MMTALAGGNAVVPLIHAFGRCTRRRGESGDVGIMAGYLGLPWAGAWSGPVAPPRHRLAGKVHGVCLPLRLGRESQRLITLFVDEAGALHRNHFGERR